MGTLFQSSHVEDRKDDGEMMLRCVLRQYFARIGGWEMGKIGSLLGFLKIPVVLHMN